MIQISETTPNKGAWKTKIILNKGRKKKQCFVSSLSLTVFIKKKKKLNNIAPVKSDMKRS